MKLSIHGSVAAAALATALGLTLAGPHRADAAPKPLSTAATAGSELGITLLSPDPQVPLSGVKPVEISAFYQGSPANQIVAIELFIDGAKQATKTLDVPETRGVVSFLINAAEISVGHHKVVVRATAADQEVTSARTSFLFGTPAPSADLSASPASANPALNAAPALPSSGGPAQTTELAPTLHLISPTTDGKVQGVVTLHVVATDPSGKAPYVSLFIDKAFKTLRNYAPYEFEWDTTAYANGYHTIEAFGYNDTPNVGHARSLRLYVNNPGGETGIRHDLLDAPKAVKTLTPKLPTVKARVTKQIAAHKRLARAEKVATLLPTRPQSTNEIVRQLAAGAGAVHFGTLNALTELSSPFAADKPAAVKTTVKTARGIETPPDAAEQSADASGEASRLAKSSLHKFTRLRKIASVRLPDSDLTTPFTAAAHLQALAPAAAPTQPHVQVHAAALAPRLTQTVLKPVVKSVMKMHPLQVHLPAGLGSLLRSVGQTSLRFDSRTVTLDRPLAAQNSILFGPLRQIFEQGGGTLTWEARTGTVRAKSATKDILLTVGDTQAIVNAKEVTLDGKPYLLMGRTMVPVSFLAAAMDANVQFDAATGHLLITSRK